MLNAPLKFVSQDTSWEYNLDKARALLASVNVAGGTLVYQTTVNSVRQKNQEIVKAALEELGFDVELKAIDASVFFSSDPGNPDTYTHFYADLEMYTDGPVTPYPVSWMDQWRSDTLAAKANDWSGTNIIRYQNPEYDELHDQARVELDPERQVELLVALNNIVVNDVAEVPIIHRAGVSAAAANLTGISRTPWASTCADLKYWRKES